jgi:hypothetical protein
MNVFIRSIGTVSFVLLSVFGSWAQTSTLPIKGWAKNSVNAAIFRRNSVVTHEGFQYTAFYNADGFVVLGKRTLGTTIWETKVTTYTGTIADAHNSISIMVDGAGFLHLSWNHHGTALNYCKSIAAGSLTLGAKIAMIGTLEGNVTYPEFHRMPSGDLIFMYRDGSSGRGNLVLNAYNVSQKKWTRLHNSLVSGENLRNAYWQAFLDKKGTIHLSWVWRETSDVASNHDLCYAKSTDGGLTWKKSDGSSYAIPITATTAEYAVRIPQNSELINQTSMFGDTLGNPYICSYWTPTGSSIPQYHVVYHNGSQWKTVQASKRTTAFSLSGSGTKKIPIARPQILIDNLNGANAVYILYRDVEQGDKVSMLYTQNLSANSWTNLNLTNYTVGSWEPSYDTELWKSKKLLHVFVQRVGQGDGETLENLEPQNVTILEWDPNVLITGVEVQAEESGDVVQCFPNPFAASFQIKAKGMFQYTIYDMTGLALEHGKGEEMATVGNGLKTGLYVVRIQSGSGEKVLKVSRV